MAALRSITQGLGALGRREFWSFRAIHALAGGLLTVFGASQTVFVNENIRREVSALDAQMASAGDRLSSIDRALFQFRFAQTNAITLGVLSANGSLRPEFRQSMVELMFVTRRLPTEMMLQQLYPTDLPTFQKEREAYSKLIEAAKKAENQADWDVVNAYEFSREAQLFEVEQQVFGERDRLAVERRKAEDRLEFAVFFGLALQQIGFVIVLFAGLVYQHRRGESAAAPVPTPR